MPRDRDELPAVRVYTVCDESRYLIVRNVPALGCGDELSNLFRLYGEIEECKPMDAEDCEAFTDVYWIKFSQGFYYFTVLHRYPKKNLNAYMERELSRLKQEIGGLYAEDMFAKRKLDESVFLGNKLKVSYALEYESLLDTKEKLEARRKEVLGRIKLGITGGSKSQVPNKPQNWVAQAPSVSSNVGQQINQREYAKGWDSHEGEHVIRHVSSNKEYFPSPSMNETVRLVREKLDKIHSSGENIAHAPASKRTRVDNRRRI